MRSWKGRLHAACIHLGVSLSIAALAAAVVFGLWYPYPYREISGGRSLFLLVVFVDVVMGPLITLVIFNRNKPRRELMTDFLVVGLLQLAALSYGIWTVFVARPVHLVYEYSRLAVVSAAQLNDEQLQKAPPELRKLPLTGPTLLSLRPLEGAKEQFDSTMLAASGVPQAAQPELWQPYDAGRAEMLATAQPLAGLRQKYPAQAALIDSEVAKTGKPEAGLLYIPVLSRDTAWSVLLDAQTARPLGFIPLDPY